MSECGFSLAGATSTLALEAREIVKTFPGVRALGGVDLDVRQGEIHALVGENGAGKSTLMHVLGGVLRAESGQVLLDGEAIRISNPHDATRRGIAVVFQELSLSPNLSIAENIFANRQPTRAGLVRSRELNRRARAMLELFELSIDPATSLKRLSLAQQQIVEILKAMSLNPKVLILDEPTSSLTGNSTELLFQNLRRLKESGVAIIYISHHLKEIFEICDCVTVLRDGQKVLTSELAGMDEAALVRAMVGRELINMYGARESEIGPVRMQVRGLARGHAFRDINFEVRSGEIVALAGLVGSGRTEVARAIFGSEPADRGTIQIEGTTLHIRSTAAAIRGGIAYVTEDRKQQGLFLKMPIRDNCVAPSLARFANAIGFMSERRIDRFAEENRSRFRIITPSVRQQVRNLSGGNQQKVLLSMWTGVRPRVLIVDEPTRGVDVGARSEIYALLRALAAEGVAILMVSSDLMEVLGMSDRVLVMRHGSIAGEFPREDATEEKIIATATGVSLN